MVRDVVAYGVLGAVVFLFLCGIVLMDDGTLLPQSVVRGAQRAYHFLASPLGTPPPGSDAELIPQGLILCFLLFAAAGFVIHLIKAYLKP